MRQEIRSLRVISFSVRLKEKVQPHQMRNMSDIPAMAPMLIPDPALVKQKVTLA
jgi:hypothetical protein